MLVPRQMRISLINQQHRRSPGPVSGRHVVDAVPDHQQAGCCDAPLRRDVQDPRRVGLRGAELARDDGRERVGGQKGCQEVRDRCAGEVVGLVEGLASFGAVLESGSGMEGLRGGDT